ncbi:MAG: hypothetical protein JSS11_09100, partial [Verrucomicrobia bacterium]|nr:hypothetical protein [Verrucomicrobiota bacterium]
TLGAGLMPAAAQERKTVTLPPPVRHPLAAPPSLDSAEAERETPLLGANYRILISATEKGRKSGELSAQTCSASFQINGCLAMPTADDPHGADLSVRGELSELEGGGLRLGYSLAVTTRVPSQTFGMPGSGQAVMSTYSFKKNGATGMLLLQPGRSYELMQISGVVYSLSITPMETWPAAKAAAPAPADAPKDAAAGPGEKPPDAAPRRGPTDEDRRRYESLSDRAREQFREALRQHFADEKFRNSPEEVRRAKIKELFDKAEAEDKGGSR